MLPILGSETETDVEQRFTGPLFENVLGYPKSELDWRKQVAIQFGREKRTKIADLVVNRNKKRVITVETKRPTEPVQPGISQVDSYAFALETPYSIVTNGRQFILRGYYGGNKKINLIDQSIDSLKYSNWDKLLNLISFDNILSASSDKANVIPEPDENQIRDYRRFFRKIHNLIRNRDKLDPGAAFDELSKMLFLKAAEDERLRIDKGSPVLTPRMIADWEKVNDAANLIDRWFQNATREYFPHVFDSSPKIQLKSSTLREALVEMEPFHVRTGDVDVKGRAFEEFLPSQLRGKGLGQFFTPRPIVNFMCDMAGISIHDVVVDFACGSGGFLIRAFEMMKRRVQEMPQGTLSRLSLTQDLLMSDIKSRQLFGIDAEPRAAKTAKMNMIMWGDGERVVRGNALDIVDHFGAKYLATEYEPSVEGSGCTLILANPPFGSKESDPEILDRYILGTKGKAKKPAKKQKRLFVEETAKSTTSEKTEILFLEKGLKLLRPAGRMLIVIPQGIMSASSYARVRDYLRSEAEIRAIVSLPTHAFVPSGVPTVNTCILYIQKFTQEKKNLYKNKIKSVPAGDIQDVIRSDPDFDYPIFMATSEFIGYDPSGRSIGEPGEQTDLTSVLNDFLQESEISLPDVDIFDFASRHYGEKSFRRKEQTIRGTTRGLKTSFVVNFRDTQERLDPPYYLFRLQADDLLKDLSPLGPDVVRSGFSFHPTTEDELDAEYSILSLSSDGKLTVGEYRKGEDPDFKTDYKYTKVLAGDVVFNPSRVNIGSIAVVSDEHSGSLVSPEYEVFKTENIDPLFLVDLLRSPFYRMYIDTESTGSIRDRLFLTDLRRIRVPKVSPDTQAGLRLEMRHGDEEIEDLLREIAGRKASAVTRMHRLVKHEPTNFADTFYSLVSAWKLGRRPRSSVKDLVRDQHYRAIIALGDRVVPYILEELSSKPDHWFVALRELTGANPVQTEDRGDLAKMAESWIAWGRANGIERPAQVDLVVSETSGISVSPDE